MWFDDLKSPGSPPYSHMNDFEEDQETWEDGMRQGCSKRLGDLFLAFCFICLFLFLFYFLLLAFGPGH